MPNDDLRYASLATLCKMANENYLESHTFPSGLRIDLYTTGEEYPQELRKCGTQEELNALIERWRYLLPEIATCKPAIADMQKAIADHAYQEQLANEKNTDILNVLMPPSLLRFMIAAHKFKVPVGVIIFQLWNAGVLKDEGTWKINAPAPQESKPPSSPPEQSAE